MTDHGAWQKFLYGREAETDSRLRLEAKLAGYDIEGEDRADGPVKQLLARAAHPDNADQGWECFQAALRAAVDDMTPAEVRTEAAMLLPEVREKLQGWRRDAALELLEGASAPSAYAVHLLAITDAVARDPTQAKALAGALEQGGRDEDVVKVLEGHRNASKTAEALVALFGHHLSVEKVALKGAMMIRDDNAMNVHRRTRMFRAQIVSLMCVVAVLVAVLVGVAIAFPLGDDAAVSNERLWAYGFLLGCIGGALSALQRTTARATRGRVPELREFKVWMWSLPLAGGAAGLAAVPLALAGVIPVKDTVEAVLATAFVAGFSERLIVRAASTLTNEPGKQGS
jgi:hypothetical protein